MITPWILVGALCPCLLSTKYTYGLLGVLGLIPLINAWLMPRKNPPSTQNAAVFITGCSSGIGNYLAQAFSLKGITVFGTVRKQADADKLGSTNIIPIIVDVTDSEGLKKAAAMVKETLVEKNLNLIACIANAGIAGMEKSLNEPESGRMEKIIDVNCTGVVRTFNSFAPLLCEGGRFFAAGSYFGSFAKSGLAVYSGSKYFLEGFADGMRKAMRNDTRAFILLKIGNITTALNTKLGEAKPVVVFNAIYNALLSSSPPDRVYIGTVQKLPTQLFCRIFDSYLPSGFYDLLTAWGMDYPVEQITTKNIHA